MKQIWLKEHCVAHGCQLFHAKAEELRLDESLCVCVHICVMVFVTTQATVENLLT